MQGVSFLMLSFCSEYRTGMKKKGVLLAPWFWVTLTCKTFHSPTHVIRLTQHKRISKLIPFPACTGVDRVELLKKEVADKAIVLRGEGREVRGQKRVDRFMPACHTALLQIQFWNICPAWTWVHQVFWASKTKHKHIDSEANPSNPQAVSVSGVECTIFFLCSLETSVSV